MEYSTRIVRSVEGLSQEEALVSLQNHPGFRPGTKIAGLSEESDRWVAKLLEPKVAGEEGLDALAEKEEEESAEPKFDDHEKHEHEKSESPMEEAEEHDNPFGDKKEKKDGPDKKIHELEKKIDKLLDALGIADEKADDILDGPSAGGPVPPPTGEVPAPKPPKMPAAGPAKGPELPPGSGAKLKPGEVPNKPGVTPIGSPAFASVRTANPAMNPPASVPPGSTQAGPAASAAACVKCGGAGCDQCRAAKAPSMPQVPPVAGTVSSFVASRLDSNRDVSIRQAKISLENEFISRGFRVARIKRDGDYLHGLMIRNGS